MSQVILVSSAERAGKRIRANERTFALLGLALIGVAAILAVEYATRKAPWAYSDGAGYFILARNLLSGRGLGLLRASGEFQPLSTHPPLYPLALAGFGLLGPDLLQVARRLDAVLLAGLVWVVGLTVYFISNRPWLGLASAVVAAGSPWVVGLFTGVQSEPLFFVTGFGSGCLLLYYFANRNRAFLVLAGLAAGLSMLTRYPGAAFVAAGVVGLLAFGRSGRREDLAIYAALSLAPNLAWLGWMNSRPGADPVRTWEWNLAGLWDRAEPIRGGLVREVWNWIPFGDVLGAVPYLLKLGVIAAIGLGLAAGLIWMLRRMDRPARLASRPLQAIGLMAVFSLAYLALLSVVFLFSLPRLDASDIDQRMMTPIYLGLVLSSFSLAALLLDARPAGTRIRLLGLAAILISLAGLLPESWQHIRELSQAGAGYTTPEWQASDTLRHLERLPAGVPIITNESTAVMFYLDRAAYDIPDLARPDSSPRLARFGEGETAEDRVFREEGAALALFDTFFWQLRGIYGDQAKARLQRLTQDLQLYAAASDGSIYFYPQSGGGDE